MEGLIIILKIRKVWTTWKIYCTKLLGYHFSFHSGVDFLAWSSFQSLKMVSPIWWNHGVRVFCHFYCDLYLYKKLILSGPGAWKRAPFYLLKSLQAFSSCTAILSSQGIDNIIATRNRLYTIYNSPANSPIIRNGKSGGLFSTDERHKPGVT